jgi:hypothetical protein
MSSRSFSTGGSPGNTMDRWYRRAAVVLWPRKRSFAVRAEAAPTRAVRELQERLRKGDLAEARAMAATVAPFWGTAVNRVEDAGFLLEVAQVAEGLDDAGLALTLLRPFWLEQLPPSAAGTLVRLVERNGEDWWRELLTAWSAKDYERALRAPSDALLWIASIPALCRALLAASNTGATAREPTAAKVARILLENRWTYVLEELRRALQARPPSQSEKAAVRLAGPIRGILAAAQVVAATGVEGAVVAAFREHDDDALLWCLVCVLRDSAGKAEARAEPRPWASPALTQLRELVVDKLKARLHRTERARDDWSLTLPPGCTCDVVCRAIRELEARCDRLTEQERREKLAVLSRLRSEPASRSEEEVSSELQEIRRARRAGWRDP